MIKKHIPNLLTSANLFSGCIGTIYAFNGELKSVAFFVILSGIFDFFDGFAARLLNVKSEIGKELDSLADVISFGLLPGAIFYLLLSIENVPYLPYLGFIVTVFSAIRLAKFNTDTRQTEDFIGLNTPMSTFFVISLPYLLDDYSFISNSWFLCGIIIVLSWLLVSEIRLFSMKFGSTSWSENKYKYIFLILSAICVLFGKFAAIPIVLMLYIILSQLHFYKIKRIIE